jgi:hypothetical protein
MPSDISKGHQSRFFYLRGALRLDLADRAGATRDFEVAVSLWPVHDNAAIRPLKDLYSAAGNEPGRKRLEDMAAKKR